MIFNRSLYGNFRTRTFQDIFPNIDKFLESFNNIGIPKKISDESATTLYYLLYGKYGNSHIASSDENKAKYRIFSIIFMYGPTWEKRLEVQEAIRNLTEDELRQGSRAIYNHSFNPSSAPSTQSTEELPTVNDQNTTNYKKSKADAYLMLWDLLKTDVTESFLYQFSKVFLKIVEPELPLWYITDINEEEEE